MASLSRVIVRCVSLCTPVTRMTTFRIHTVTDVSTDYNKTNYEKSLVWLNSFMSDSGMLHMHKNLHNFFTACII